MAALSECRSLPFQMPGAPVAATCSFGNDVSKKQISTVCENIGWLQTVKAASASHVPGTGQPLMVYRHQQKGFDFNSKLEKTEFARQSTCQRRQANTNRVKVLLHTANAYCGPVKYLAALSGRSVVTVAVVTGERSTLSAIHSEIPASSSSLSNTMSLLHCPDIYSASGGKADTFNSPIYLMKLPLLLQTFQMGKPEVG